MDITIHYHVVEHEQLGARLVAAKIEPKRYFLTGRTGYFQVHTFEVHSFEPTVKPFPQTTMCEHILYYICILLSSSLLFSFEAMKTLMMTVLIVLAGQSS